MIAYTLEAGAVYATQSKVYINGSTEFSGNFGGFRGGMQGHDGWGVDLGTNRGRTADDNQRGVFWWRIGYVYDVVEFVGSHLVLMVHAHFSWLGLLLRLSR